VGPMGLVGAVAPQVRRVVACQAHRTKRAFGSYLHLVGVGQPQMVAPTYPRVEERLVVAALDKVARGRSGR